MAAYNVQMRPKGREKTKRPGRFRASKVWDLNPRIIGQLHDAFSTKALWRGFCQQSNFAFKEIYYTDRSMMVTAGVTIVADTAEAIKSPVKCDFVSCLIVKVSVHIRGYGDPYSIYIYIYSETTPTVTRQTNVSRVRYPSLQRYKG